MANKDTLKTASVLAFERKLDVSDALMFAGIGNDAMNLRVGNRSRYVKSPFAALFLTD
jgi:hypothetical protein